MKQRHAVIILFALIVVTGLVSAFFVASRITDPLNAAMKEPTKKQAPKKKVTGKSSTSKPETFAEKKARLAAEGKDRRIDVNGKIRIVDRVLRGTAREKGRTGKEAEE